MNPLDQAVNPGDVFNIRRMAEQRAAANKAVSHTIEGGESLTTGTGRTVIPPNQRFVGMPVSVKLSAAGTDVGKYLGWIGFPPIGVVRDGTGALSSADVNDYNDGGPEDTLICVLSEIGATGHPLDSLANDVREFNGRLIDVNDDGLFVVVVDGIGLKICS